MTDELKSTQVCYGENVQMMRIDDCIVFGNKDSLRRIVEKMTECREKGIAPDYTDYDFGKWWYWGGDR